MTIHRGVFGVLLSVGVAACAPAERDDQVERETAVEPVRVVMTEDVQQRLTPEAVLAQLTEGNQRFVEGNLTPRDYLAQAEATSEGQYPKAIILGCVDSRVPPEIVFDQGIGDLFVGRVAGNFENVDLLGSLEFATAVAGTPLIVVLGHTYCGAIIGAAAGVELGNLTTMLENFDDVLETVRQMREWIVEPSNSEAIEAVIVENVRQTVSDILERSEVIAGLVESGDVAVVGGVYDLASGQVTWLDEDV